MDKEEFLALVKCYFNDTITSSNHRIDHPAYIKLIKVGLEILPFAFERLQDSVGHDYGNKMDHDNDPWILMMLIGELTNGECTLELPKKHIGKLKPIRNHILNWGKLKGYVK